MKPLPLVFRILPLGLISLATAHGQIADFDVVSWNVESDGARVSTIARQLREDFSSVELWGFSEVAGADAASQFEVAAEDGETIDYGSVIGTTGDRDRLLVFFDKGRFDLRGSEELHDINVGGRVRSPLVVRLRDRASGADFSFMVNHLYRGNSDGRHRQATMLKEWAQRQTEPVIAVGDYNFDWNYQAGDQDHDRGYDNMTADGSWKWIRPAVLVPTNASGHESVLDFIFFSALPDERLRWDAISTILVRQGDFPNTDLNSDHRPVLATFSRSAAPASPPPPPPMSPQPAAVAAAINEAYNPGSTDPEAWAALLNGVREQPPAGLAPRAPIGRRIASSAGTPVPLPGVAPAPPTPAASEAPPQFSLLPQAIANEPITHHIMRGHHPRARVSHDAEIEAALGRAGVASPQSVLSVSKLWRPGQSVTVAFRGGDRELHRNIAEAASEWSRYGNLKFDFGTDASGNFRQWTTADLRPAADIRISFDKEGYYSLVGRDALVRRNAGPNEETMNFEGFTFELPLDWQSTVLHEFGHAIGFQHEHQSPIGGCDFRWDDDPGYVRTLDQFSQVIRDSAGRRPGIYSVLGGKPNEWDRATVDFNLRELHDEAMDPLRTSQQFDRFSIMKYYFEPWMFAGGRQSHCFTNRPNEVLSDTDKFAMLEAYPQDIPAATLKVAQRQAAVDLMERVVEKADVKNSLNSLK